MAKQITNTPSHYVGQIRTDFMNPDFDVLVDNKGNDAVWERAIPCPCTGRDKAAQTICKNCLGTGWVFINPKQIKAIVQSINRNTEYKEWTTALLGTVNLTVKAEHQFNYMDRVTILNSNSIHSEVRILLQDSQNTFCTTIYPIKSIVDIFLFESPYKPLKLLKFEEDYTFSQNTIFFPKIEREKVVSITYKHDIQYHVLDLNHDVRNTILLDDFSREVQLKLPVSAIARRAHSVLPDVGVEGYEIFDNSY